MLLDLRYIRIWQPNEDQKNQLKHLRLNLGYPIISCEKVICMETTKPCVCEANISLDLSSSLPATNVCAAGEWRESFGALSHTSSFSQVLNE